MYFTLLNLFIHSNIFLENLLGFLIFKSIICNRYFNSLFLFRGISFHFLFGMVRTSTAMLNRSSERCLVHDFRVNTQSFIIRYNYAYRFIEIAFVMLAK